MILAGDVGGTKTVLGLFEADGSGLRCITEERLSSRDHVALEDAIGEFLGASGSPEIASACFGIAGPVIEGRVRATNLPWELSVETLAKACGTSRVELLNDLQACAWGMLVLDDDCFEVLNEGGVHRSPGHIAVVAPGTGLGIGLLIWDGERHHPVATEAGHVDFAPQGEEQIALYRYLRDKLGGHVSTERILSGPGLVDVYRFLREQSGVPEPRTLTDRRRAGDDAAVISEAGLADQDPVCVRALQLFVEVLGAEAGNAALRTLTRGGVYLAGGIPPKILPALRGNRFLDAYLDKGRFRPLLADVRVAVCLESRAPLLGAAHRAHDLVR